VVLYCHTGVVLYCHTGVVLYCHTGVVVYCHTSVVVYCHTSVVLYCHTGVVLYCHTSVVPVERLEFDLLRNYCACVSFGSEICNNNSMNDIQPDRLQQKLYRYGNWPEAACAGEVNVWQWLVQYSDNVG
jgi:hypothetical protein